VLPRPIANKICPVIFYIKKLKFDGGYLVCCSDITGSSLHVNYKINKKNTKLAYTVRSKSQLHNQKAEAKMAQTIMKKIATENL
jgi:hypothetical protein